MKLIINKKFLIIVGLMFSMGVLVTSTNANHSWGKYHWNLSTAQTEVTPLKLGDNLSSEWTSSLVGTSNDWNFSVLKNQVVAGTNTACDPVIGGVEVCNSEYGDNGWLGIAQIWAYRGKAGHIAQALVKLNDTYFDTAEYNTQSWRDFVMCQEVGHTFGLDHQDENFSNVNLGTCMDYTSDPDGTLFGQSDNRHPNQHDFDEMTEIYAHLNGVDDNSGPGNGNGKGKKGKPAGVGVDINLNNPSAWGQAIKQDAQGKSSLFSRDLGNGQVLITHVFWVY